jgi:SagB-type dehydrogenase family enzyme
MNGSIGDEFMTQTRYGNFGASDQMRSKPQPPLELPLREGSMTIRLPPPQGIGVKPHDLREAIESRESVRVYSGEPLSLDELSFLLWSTQGIKRILPGRATFRTVPSAGARHAIETYLLINAVRGLVTGIYRFIATRHTLEEIDVQSGIAERVTKACLDQRFIAASAVTFLWTAVAYRMTWRYGDRGYRYIHLDAGHICQNLYLAAGAIGCGACAIGAFNDEALNRTIGIDGTTHFVVYLATVGKKR